MRPNSRLASLAGLVVGMALITAACSASATPSAAVAAATAVPTTVATDTTAASPVDTAAAAATTSAPAGPASLTIASTPDSTLGEYLTGLNGMTLYVLTLDKADSSSCSGSCATNWPPLTVADGTTITGPSSATGDFATITRADGTMQVTYNHMPLYYFAGDSAAGDTKGQVKNGTWFVAPVSGSVANAPSPTSGY